MTIVPLLSAEIACFLYKMVIIDIKFIMAMIVVIVILAAMVVT